MKELFSSQFKEAFGEILFPKGFLLLKSKYPYFVRITNDGIIQSISYEKKKSDFNTEGEGFMLWIGLSLITLPMTDYNCKPNTLENQTWMIAYIDFIHSCSLSLDGFEKKGTKFSYFYQKGNHVEMVNALQSAISEQIPFIIDFFDRYATIDDLYQLNGLMRFGFYQDIVILKQKVDEYLEERKIEFAKEYEQAVSVIENNPMMKRFAERQKKDLLKKNNRIIQWLMDRKIGGAEYEEYMNNAYDIKKKNIELLAEFGVNI